MAFINRYAGAFKAGRATQAMATARVEPTSADPRTVQHKTATEQRASAVPKVVLVFTGVASRLS